MTGAELLAAVVADYEVNCRLGMAIDLGSHYDRGFHGTATCGTFAATAAAGKIAGLDADELENAFGLNGSQASGSIQFLANGSWNKRLHPGLAAHAGVLAVAFAEAGFYGTEAPIEGDDGFLNGYSDDPKPELATADLGKKFERGSSRTPVVGTCTRRSIPSSTSSMRSRSPSRTSMPVLVGNSVQWLKTAASRRRERRQVPRALQRRRR